MADPSRPDLPDDEHLLDTCVDVARNVAAYGRYGTQRKALAALRRRAPGFAPAQYEALLDLFCALVHAARDAVPRHVRPDPRPPNPDGSPTYAAYEDVDEAACLVELDRLSPGFALGQKRAIVSWSILYDYLM